MSTQVLIDADILTFAAGFAAQETRWKLRKARGTSVFPSIKSAREAGYERCDLERDIIPEPLENALHNVKSMEWRIMNRLCGAFHDIEQPLFVFSSPPIFRNNIATIAPYKGNRDPLHRPYWEKDIKKYLFLNRTTTLMRGLEADDVMGIMATTRPAGECVLASIDKDLKQIPGFHYDWRDQSLVSINKWEAAHNFWKQVLIGDSADNIIGLPQIGPKRAEDILKPCTISTTQLAQTVFETYQNLTLTSSGLKELDKDVRRGVGAYWFMENARLLWLRKREQKEFYHVPQYSWWEQYADYRNS